MKAVGLKETVKKQYLTTFWLLFSK